MCPYRPAAEGDETMSLDRTARHVSEYSDAKDHAGLCRDQTYVDTPSRFRLLEHLEQVAVGVTD